MDMGDIKGTWDYRIETRRFRLWNLPILPVIPYPARSAKLSIDINLTGCWWKPSYTYRSRLSEREKREGEMIWWARWLIFQISYSRFL